MSKFSIKLLQTICVLFLHIIAINNALFSQDLSSFIEGNLSNQPVEKLDTIILDPDTKNDPLALDSLKTPVFKYSTKTFYENRNYKALWYSEIRLLESAKKLLTIIKNISDEGISPERYYLTKLQYLYDQVDNIWLNLYQADLNDLSLLDIECTEAALQLANDLRFGVIDPAELSLQWEIPRDSVDLTRQLVDAIEQNTLTVFFESLKPKIAPYRNLKSKLEALKQKAKRDTDLTQLKAKQKLEVGTYDEQIVLLRKRVNFLIDQKEQRIPNRSVTVKEANELSSNRDLQNMEDFSVCNDTIYVTRDSFQIIKDTSYTTYENVIESINGIAMIYDPTYYDSTLFQSVKQFQRAYGLTPDGVIGPKTIKTLNKPFSEMVYKAEMNLDRWRWLSRELTDRYIIVNIAGFYLDVFENNEVVMRKQVMVGATKTETPIFSNMLQYIEMNPTWTVPYSISSRELLPKIQKDPDYLARNDYKLLSGGSSIDPHSVDWSTIKKNNFPYVIRQKAGRQNALGQIKFIFPNRYNVYLHDTQSKSKFKKYSRAYSHGCIRLEEPMELAEFIFQDDPEWSLESLTNVLNKRKTKRVHLKEPIPIILFYWTAYVDEKGELIFRDDVYKRDKVVLPIWKRKNRL